MAPRNVRRDKGPNFTSHRRASTAGWQNQSHILVDTVIHDLQWGNDTGVSAPLTGSSKFTTVIFTACAIPGLTNFGTLLDLLGFAVIPSRCAAENPRCANS